MTNNEAPRSGDGGLRIRLRAFAEKMVRDSNAITANGPPGRFEDQAFGVVVDHLLTLWESAYQQGSVETLHRLTAPTTELLTFRYENWKGVTSVRHVRPLYVWYGATSYHPVPTYLLRAFDLGKKDIRDFAFDKMERT